MIELEPDWEEIDRPLRELAEIKRRLRDREARQFGFADAGELDERTEMEIRAIRAGKPRFIEVAGLELAGAQGDFHIYQAQLLTDLELGRLELDSALDCGFRGQWPFVAGICGSCGVEIRLPSALVHIEGQGDSARLVTNQDTDSPGEACVCPMHGPGTNHWLRPMGDAAGTAYSYAHAVQAQNARGCHQRPR